MGKEAALRKCRRSANKELDFASDTLQLEAEAGFSVSMEKVSRWERNSLQ